MRDIKRIDRITYRLSQLWHKHPDLRFGQLVESLTSYDEDLFYLEDKEIEKKIIEYDRRTD